jgi:hypothetical protein
MQNTKQRDAAQMERLAATPSTWRILNLHRTLRLLFETKGVTHGFFSNRRLANAIVIKHTLRDHERSMFEKDKVVATKILVPMDGQSFSTGAISFFVNERAYPAIMRQSFGINVSTAARERDARILEKLDETPSLDLFLLREQLGSDEYGIPRDYFQVSLLEDSAIRSYVTRELTPLIRIAIESANGGAINKFVDSIFGTELRAPAEDFFRSLGLVDSSWNSVVFAWKAALFYETQFATMKARLEAMRATLGALKTYGHSDLYPRSFVEVHLKDLKGFTDRAYQRSLDSAKEFNSARRAQIIEDGRIGELKDYLERLPDNVYGFGGFSALIDHVLSYWTFRMRSMNPERLPAELFCTVAADICALEHQFDIGPSGTDDVFGVNAWA